METADTGALTRKDFRGAVISCYMSYVVQAIVNNLPPLLFVRFHEELGVSLGLITALSALNFTVQILVDFASVWFIDRIGYRAAMVISHLSSFTGLAMLSFLPDVMPSPFAGLLISMVFYSIGGGLLEIGISPLMDSIPSDSREASMSLLHSFYCWGHAAVILLSTLFFRLAGIRNWRFLTLLWSAVPLVYCFVFATVKLPESRFVREAEEQGEKVEAHLKNIGKLMRQGGFWLLFFMMIFAGSSEQAVSQWVSTFAELGLHISKTSGDLVGALLFAVSMACSRMLYGRIGKKIPIRPVMLGGALLMALCYAGVAFIPVPLVKLILCGLCGFFVGVLWPGACSIGGIRFGRYGTLIFSLMALSGDIGCTSGPALVGAVSEAAGGDLTAGLSAAVIFPLAMAVCIVIMIVSDKKHKRAM